MNPFRRSIRLAAVVVLLAGGAAAQTGQSAAPGVTLTAPVATLEQLRTQVNARLEETHPQHWKLKADEHDAVVRNYLSIHNDLEQVLPGLLKAAEDSPRSVAAGLALYRNVNALYDVMVRLEQSSELVGRDDVIPLQDALSQLETARGALAEKLIALSVQQEATVAQAQQVLAAQAAAPPKKIVADDDAPAKKPTGKATTAKSAGTKQATKSTSKAAAKPAAGTPASQ